MALALTPQALSRPGRLAQGSAVPAVAVAAHPRAAFTASSPAAAGAAARCCRQRDIAWFRVAAAAAEAHTEGAAPGDYVEAHYSIISDGEVFDTSRAEGGKQAQFILGSGAHVC